MIKNKEKKKNCKLSYSQRSQPICDFSIICSPRAILKSSSSSFRMPKCVRRISEQTACTSIQVYYIKQKQQLLLEPISQDKLWNRYIIKASCFRAHPCWTPILNLHYRRVEKKKERKKERNYKKLTQMHYFFFGIFDTVSVTVLCTKNKMK